MDVQLFEGPVEKTSSRFLKNKSKVWMVLGSQTISMFKDQQKKICVSSIEVTDIQSVTAVDHQDCAAFVVGLPHISYTFNCDSADQRDKWVTAIQAAQTTPATTRTPPSAMNGVKSPAGSSETTAPVKHSHRERSPESPGAKSNIFGVKLKSRTSSFTKPTPVEEKSSGAKPISLSIKPSTSIRKSSFTDASPPPKPSPVTPTSKIVSAVSPGLKPRPANEFSPFSTSKSPPTASISKDSDTIEESKISPAIPTDRPSGTIVSPTTPKLPTPIESSPCPTFSKASSDQLKQTNIETKPDVIYAKPNKVKNAQNDQTNDSNPDVKDKVADTGFKRPMVPKCTDSGYVSVADPVYEDINVTSETTAKPSSPVEKRPHNTNMRKENNPDYESIGDSKYADIVAISADAGEQCSSTEKRGNVAGSGDYEDVVFRNSRCSSSPGEENTEPAIVDGVDISQVPMRNSSRLSRGSRNTISTRSNSDTRSDLAGYDTADNVLAQREAALKLKAAADSPTELNFDDSVNDTKPIFTLNNPDALCNGGGHSDLSTDAFKRLKSFLDSRGKEPFDVDDHIIETKDPITRLKELIGDL